MMSPRVLFISSNGAGMGHLTRLLAYARRCEPTLIPYFFSLSQAVPVVTTFGYPYEYLASRDASGMPTRRWHDYLARSLSDTIDRIKPAIAVFDGTWPYEGIRLAQGASPNVRWVWSRRGMWRDDRNRGQLSKASWFDLVLEPGDFASQRDRGGTAREPAARVGPVTLLEVDEIEPRSEARRALGLPLDRPCALVTLGAGTINDISGDLTASIAALRELGVEVCVTDPVIASANVDHEHVHVVREYPLSRYYHAFDVAISACGYNSFHELLRFGVPSLFVPNRATALDDQGARAEWAAAAGVALHVDTVTADKVRPMLELLLADDTLPARIAKIDPGNGSTGGAHHIMQLMTR